MKKFNKFYHASVVATIIVVVLLSGSTVAINHFEPKTIEQNLKSLDEFRNKLHVYDEVPTLDDNDIPPFLLFIDRMVYRLNNILHRLLVIIYAITNKGQGEIQKAIDAASPGDTVEIPSGIYYENILIYKPITLLGEDPETTIIDGGGGSKDGGLSAKNVVKITSNDVTISGFTIRNGEADGVVFVSSNVAVTNNIITQNNGTGIRSSKSLEFILNETDNIIHGNTITNNTYGGIAVRFNNDLQISNNDIQNNGDVGIQVLDSSNVTVSDNTVHHNHIAGIHIWLSRNCEVLDNSITDTMNVNGWGTGIKLSTTVDSTVVNNQISDNEASGIILYGNSVRCTLEKNVVTHNCINTENAAWGIVASDGYDHVILDNSITKNPSYALGMIDIPGSVIQGNMIADNAAGLDLRGIDTEVVITENTIANHSGIGYITSESSSATIFYNNFINNTGRVFCDDYCYNLYDWNYWSDYSGVDTDGDGIGNSPFTLPPVISYLPIDKLIIDNYPFMQPNGWRDYVPPEEPVASFIYIPNYDINRTTPIQFISTSTDANGFIVEQQWQMGEAAEWVIVDNPTHLFEEPGFYPVSLIVTDDTGNSSKIYTRLVRVDPFVPIIRCSKNTVERTLTVTGYVVYGSAGNYLWEDFENTGTGSCTIPDGALSIGDVITDCTGQIKLEYKNGAIAGEWIFP
ncbi:MAG: right-handed parallel beta-helix repeat-containing protein [Thermoplasmatales archaeon]|nr:MAG: right-handed parallel beta-helix repeat-containing protein [Thermoplasmatales archaeon]